MYCALIVIVWRICRRVALLPVGKLGGLLRTSALLATAEEDDDGDEDEEKEAADTTAGGDRADRKAARFGLAGFFRAWGGSGR